MKEKYEVGYVVLHYVAIKDTVACVNSIRNISEKHKYKIVIVDNFSPDNSGTLLLEKYQNCPDIDIVISKENLGFAKGNNLGIKYFREQYDAEFIVVSNNDILITQDDFIEKLFASYERQPFDLLGPLVLTADGKYTSSPQRKKVWTLVELQQYKKRMEDLQKFNQIHLRKVYSALHRTKEEPAFTNEDHIHYMKNVQIHGCFFVLSKLFFEKMDGLDPRTFMYMEEDILYAKLMKAGGTTVYDPRLIVFHQKGRATVMTEKNKQKKYSFLLKNLLTSASVLEEVLKGN